MIRCRPTGLALAWTGLCLLGLLVSASSLLQLQFRVRPDLVRRGSWDHLGVRQVVRSYRRRDINRCLRLSGFVGIGVAALFAGPPAPRRRGATLMIAAVALEVVDTVRDFRYRQGWLRPGPGPPARP